MCGSKINSKNSIYASSSRNMYSTHISRLNFIAKNNVIFFYKCAPEVNTKFQSYIWLRSLGIVINVCISISQLVLVYFFICLFVQSWIDLENPKCSRSNRPQNNGLKQANKKKKTHNHHKCWAQICLDTLFVIDT